MMSSISLREDRSSMVNGDNLSLVSIASALRRGSPLEDDFIYNKPVKKSMIYKSNEKNQDLVNITIDETINKLSDLSLKKKSETLSTIGNKCANSGQNWEAIRYYSKAISLFDEDYRLYCNRSYCYERLMNFEDSLADALRSVILMPTKPKPYFRQGKALIGLKRYSDAEKAFNKILEINRNCEDTKKELLKTRYLALRDYGLNIEDASIAAINHKSVEEAIEASVGKKIDDNIGCESGFGISFEYLNDIKTEDFDHNLNDSNNWHKYSPTVKSFTPLKRFNGYKRSQSRPPARLSHTFLNQSIDGNITKSTHFMHKRSHSVDNVMKYKKCDPMSVKRFREYRLPKNLFGYKGLWIGNVSPNCKVSQLRSIFGKYGSLDYINVVGNSFCAFVNFHNHNSPRLAIAYLYGQVIPGVSNGERPLVFRFIPSNSQKDLHYMRPYQPKGTNECYFWRTTGCKDNNCPLLHYPVCRGIDFQPWMNRRYKKFF